MIENIYSASTNCKKVGTAAFISDKFQNMEYYQRQKGTHHYAIMAD